MSTKKILCITNDFGPRAGGIESFIIGLIERFPKDSVVVYTSSQEGDLKWDAAWKENFGVKVIRDKSKILLPTLRVGAKARKIVREENIESVFFGAAAPLGLLAKGLRKCGVKKIVALTHGHEVWWAKVFPFKLAIYQIGKSVDHLTYLGEFTRLAIAKSLRQSSKNSMVRIAPGIDVDHFKPSKQARELRKLLGIDEKKVIVSVGRLVHRKGQDRLIQGLSQIKRSIPEAHLLLIGEGPYREYLEKLAEKLGVLPDVTFVGRVQYVDLAKYISAGEIFAMPSRSRFGGLEVEGLGIVYLEASACGIAVIAGKSGGAPDAIIEGVTGLAVDGNNVKEIAEKIIYLLENPEAAKKMGEQGRNWIIESWRWEIWAKKFQDLL